MTERPSTPEAVRALARGDVPRAPGLTGLCAVAGGLLGLTLAAAATVEEIPPLVHHAFLALDAAAAWETGRGLFGRLTLWPLAGAVLGAVAGHRWVAPSAFGLRVRAGAGRPARLPVWASVVGLAAPLLAGLALPGLLPAADAGYVLVYAPVAAVGAALCLMLAPALVQRGRAMRAWRRRVAPEPPPRRPPDQPPAEVRDALREARRRQHDAG